MEHLPPSRGTVPKSRPRGLPRLPWQEFQNYYYNVQQGLVPPAVSASGGGRLGPARNWLGGVDSFCIDPRMIAANTTYASHVHKQACADGDADGHYRFDPAGAATPPNEIWPGPFTTNDVGIGNANTIAWGTAGSTAISVVVHAPGGAKIACADLG